MLVYRHNKITKEDIASKIRLNDLLTDDNISETDRIIIRAFINIIFDMLNCKEELIHFELFHCYVRAEGVKENFSLIGYKEILYSLDEVHKNWSSITNETFFEYAKKYLYDSVGYFIRRRYR